MYDLYKRNKNGMIFLNYVKTKNQKLTVQISKELLARNS